MYQIGELIVYGNTGVCRVVDISTPKISHVDRTQLYYCLEPLFESGTIYAPVNTKVFIRPIISAEEVNSLIDMIPSVQTQAVQSSRAQELAEHYQTAIKSHSCANLIELLMSIYAKRVDAELQKRKLGQVDERFMRRAEDLLHGEFSVALGIDKDDVPGYIAARVEALMGSAAGDCPAT